MRRRFVCPLPAVRAEEPGGIPVLRPQCDFYAHLRPRAIGRRLSYRCTAAKSRCCRVPLVEEAARWSAPGLRRTIPCALGGLPRRLAHRALPPRCTRAPSADSQPAPEGRSSPDDEARPSPHTGVAAPAAGLSASPAAPSAIGCFGIAAGVHARPVPPLKVARGACTMRLCERVGQQVCKVMQVVVESR